MTYNEVLKQVCGIAWQYFGTEVIGDIVPEYHLNADSLDMIDFVMKLEEIFFIDISDNMFRKEILHKSISLKQIAKIIWEQQQTVDAKITRLGYDIMNLQKDILNRNHVLTRPYLFTR